MTAGGHRDEQKLIGDVLAGAPSAINRFLDLAGTTIWPAVIALVGEGPAADAAFLSVITRLRKDNFGRLSRYDGRSRLSTFLILITRDLLGEEVAELFSLDSNRAWRRFDRLFAKEIGERIRRRFPRADDARQQDLYQEIAAKLLEENFRRIRLYDGRGSFCGYVMLVVDRLLIDLLRQEAPRRRLPAEIARLSELHRLLFAAGAWLGVPLDPERMAVALEGKLAPPPGRADLIAALERVSGAIAAAQANTAPQEISLDAGGEGKAVPQIPSSAANAEDALLEREQEEAWEALLDRVRREAETLPADLQFYLRLLLQASDPMPPREIAREMAIPVEHVYKLQQRTKLWMKNIATDLQKNASLSV